MYVVISCFPLADYPAGCGSPDRNPSWLYFLSIYFKGKKTTGVVLKKTTKFKEFDIQEEKSVNIHTHTTVTVTTQLQTRNERRGGREIQEHYRGTLF